MEVLYATLAWEVYNYLACVHDQGSVSQAQQVLHQTKDITPAKFPMQELEKQFSTGVVE